MGEVEAARRDGGGMASKRSNKTTARAKPRGSSTQSAQKAEKADSGGLSPRGREILSLVLLGLTAFLALEPGAERAQIVDESAGLVLERVHAGQRQQLATMVAGLHDDGFERQRRSAVAGGDGDLGGVEPELVQSVEAGVDQQPGNLRNWACSACKYTKPANTTAGRGWLS